MVAQSQSLRSHVLLATSRKILFTLLVVSVLALVASASVEACSFYTMCSDCEAASCCWALNPSIPPPSNVRKRAEFLEHVESVDRSDLLRRSVEQAGSCVVIYDTCEKKCSSVRTPGAPIPTLPPSPSPTPTPTPVPTPSSLPSPPPSPTGTSCTSPPPASSGFNCVDSQWISNSSMVVTNTSTIVYANFSIQGDLSIENNSTLSITNSAFNLSGNLLVKGGGEIVISHVGAGSTIQGNFSISKGSHASIKIGENALKVLGCMQLEGQLRVEIQASVDHDTLDKEYKLLEFGSCPPSGDFSKTEVELAASECRTVESMEVAPRQSVLMMSVKFDDSACNAQVQISAATTTEFADALSLLLSLATIFLA